MIQSLFNHRKIGCYGDALLIRFTLKDETVFLKQMQPIGPDCRPVRISDFEHFEADAGYFPAFPPPDPGRSDWFLKARALLLVETLVGFAGVPGKRSATTIPALVLGPEINPKRILDLLPFQNNLFHVQFLTVIKDRSPRRQSRSISIICWEALRSPAFEAAHSLLVSWFPKDQQGHPS